jgi:hypothetical protein
VWYLSDELDVFHCDLCHVFHERRHLDPRTECICIWRTNEATPLAQRHWILWCPWGRHETRFEQAANDDGHAHHNYNGCRDIGTPVTAPSSPQRSPSHASRDYDLPSRIGARRNQRGEHRPGLSKRQRARRVERMAVADPPLEPSSDT